MSTPSNRASSSTFSSRNCARSTPSVRTTDSSASSHSLVSRASMSTLLTSDISRFPLVMHACAIHACALKLLLTLLGAAQRAFNTRTFFAHFQQRFFNKSQMAIAGLTRLFRLAVDHCLHQPLPVCIQLADNAFLLLQRFQV